jgi:hypothetical protein
MLSYTQRSDFLQNGDENLHLWSREIRSSLDGWFARNPRAIYMEFFYDGQMTKLLLEHEMRYTPLRGNILK